MPKLRGIQSLLFDAIDFTVDMVEEGHDSVGRNAMRVAARLPGVAEPASRADELRRVVTSLALDSVRGVSRSVQRLTEIGLDFAPAAAAAAPIAMRSDIVGTAPWLADASLGALNGAVGDYLHREKNELDLGFVLRSGDAYFDSEVPPLATKRKLAVFVHGLGTTEWSWCWEAQTYHGDAASCFGTLLERDLGFTPLYARYNSGRRVHENGRLLSEALARLEAVYGAELDDLILIGHSMGGLVVRSACHQASERGEAWVRRVSRVLSLGTPHQGAPLEKLGHLATTVLGAIDLPGTRIPAAILQRRSAGMRDLRHGTVADDARSVPLLDHVAYWFVAATVTRDREHPVGHLIGDVLVRVPSASGPSQSERKFRIETECFGGIVHQELQNHPDVYALVRRACEARSTSEDPRS
jgi:pimeloyl-ACP methyl ester carboxylesterase